MKRFLLFALLSFPLLGVGCVRLNAGPSDGGVFRSGTGGETWEQRVFVREEKKKVITISDLDVAALVYDLQNPDRLFLGSVNQGIWKTSNAGEVWEQTTFRNGTWKTLDLHPSVSQTLIGASGVNIFKSLDDGQSWQTIYTETTGKEIAAVQFDKFQSSHILAVTVDGSFLRSEDDGVNWEVVSRIPAIVRKMVIDPRTSSMIYLTTERNGIYKSTDGGKAFSNITLGFNKNFPGVEIVNDLVLVPMRPQEILLATNYGLLKSDDEGFSFRAVKTLLPPKTAIHRIAIDPIHPFIFSFTVGRIVHKTADGGETWKVIEDFPSRRFIQVLIPHPSSADVLVAGMLKLKK